MREQFFSKFIAWTCYFLMIWWQCLFCNRPTCLDLLDFYSATASSLKNHDGHILLWQGINCQSSAVNFLHDPLLPLLFNSDKCPGLAHLTTSYQMCSPPYIHFCIHTSSYNIISHIYIYLSFICISIKTYSNRHTPV
jgi:hypothetical protein